MHRETGTPHAVIQGLFLRVHAGERWKKRRVDIENSLRKLLHEPRREQSHIPSEAHPLHIVLLQSRNHRLIMLFAGPPSGWNHDAGEPALLRRLDSRCVALVRDDYSNPSIRNAP